MAFWKHALVKLCLIHHGVHHLQSVKFYGLNTLNESKRTNKRQTQGEIPLSAG
jgi:hypothetical protein